MLKEDLSTALAEQFDKLQDEINSVRETLEVVYDIIDKLGGMDAVDELIEDDEIDSHIIRVLDMLEELEF